MTDSLTNLSTSCRQIRSALYPASGGEKKKEISSVGQGKIREKKSFVFFHKK